MYWTTLSWIVFTYIWVEATWTFFFRVWSPTSWELGVGFSSWVCHILYMFCVIHRLHIPQGRHFISWAWTLICKMEITIPELTHHTVDHDPRRCAQSSTLVIDMSFSCTAYTMLRRHCVFPWILCSPAHRTFYSDGYILSNSILSNKENTSRLLLLSTWNMATVIEELFTFI